jgi:tetratricopeptide (TPR) repeat protein
MFGLFSAFGVQEFDGYGTCSPSAMVRILIVLVALLGQTAIHAQERARPDLNPLAKDELWRFHAGAEAFAGARKRAASGEASVDVIKANFTIGSKTEALAAARRLFAASPAELANGLDLINERSHEFDGTLRERDLVSFVADARARVNSLAVADGANAALPLLWLEYVVDRGNEPAHQARIAAFLERYKGTTAAVELSLSQIVTDNPHDDAGRLRRYRELAREHDGTEAGASVLRHLGFRLAHDTEGPDPTPRLLEVFDIVRRLESGRFPPSRYVDSAGELVVDFFFGSHVNIPAENIPRIYAAYLEFVLSHPTVKIRTNDDPISWLIRNGVARLGASPAERVATVERFLDDLEKGGIGVNEVRHKRAYFYLELTEDPGNISDHLEGALSVPEADALARRALRAMIDSGDPDAFARAHGTLAAYHLGDRRYPDAVSSYSALLQRFPDKEWAWVAALRLAQLAEVQGRPDAALRYESVASGFKHVSTAVLLANLSAGHVHESRANFPAATGAFRTALAEWQDLPEQIDLWGNGDDSGHAERVFRRFVYFKKGDLVTRLDRLANAVTADTALLHQGRHAIEEGRPKDALAPLNKLVTEFPKTAAAVEGIELLRRARFTIALTPLAQASQRELDTLSRGRYDKVTTLAKLALGAIRLRNGARVQGESITKAALEEWHAQQAVAAPPTTPLMQDIAAIRAELFRPMGGGLFGTQGGNAFDWPKVMPSFLVVSRDIEVKLLDGTERKLSVPFSPSTGRVLFASDEDLAAMRLILDRIGGTETREPAAVMETPNQPIGASVTIAETWSKFFPLQPGHWGGWELTAYPYITKVTFDREHHALAEVTIGYGGYTVELEKENGKWIAKRIVGVWIT